MDGNVLSTSINRQSRNVLVQGETRLIGKPCPIPLTCTPIDVLISLLQSPAVAIIAYWWTACQSSGTDSGTASKIRRLNVLELILGLCRSSRSCLLVENRSRRGIRTSCQSVRGVAIRLRPRPLRLSTLSVSWYRCQVRLIMETDTLNSRATRRWLRPAYIRVTMRMTTNGVE